MATTTTTTSSAAASLRRFENKVAVLTASTEGMGFAIAERLAQEGCKVVISSRKQDNVDKALAKLKSQNLECHGVVCDAGKKEHRQKLLEEANNKYGGIDILVSNAAVNPHIGYAFDISETAWNKIFDVNVKSSFFLIKEALPYLEKRKNSNVLLMASVAGLKPATFKRLIPYAISKTAVIAMTRGLSQPLSLKGIRINCLAPGPIETDFVQNAANTAVVDYDNDRKKMLKQVGFLIYERFGQPKEITGAAAFLTSDEASYITGETVVIAGGLAARL